MVIDVYYFIIMDTNHSELWCFSLNYTEYLAESIWDIAEWLGTPSVIVIDCSDTGKIYNNFCDYQIAMMRQKQLSKKNNNNNNGGNNNDDRDDDDSLQKDKAQEIHPTNPHYPKDTITSPMRMAIKFFGNASVLSDVKDEIIDLLFDPSIGGIMKNKNTSLGESDWIFLSATDIIAWNVLHTKLSQRLSRVDVVVPSLFCNFLLVERIVKSMNRTPLSIPNILATHNLLM